MSIGIKNPCKYCLTKPACDRKCQDLIDHIEFYEIVGAIALVLFSFLFIISIPIIGYKYGYKIISLSGITLYLILVYGWLYITHKKHPNELKQMDKWERVTIIIIFPYAVFTVPISHWVVEKLKVHNLFFRYHTTLNPHKGE